MAFCSNCGQELLENAPVCPNCGTVQGSTNMEGTVVENQPAEKEDKGGFLWGLLGCCIPLVGLIMFLVWKDTKPKTAKAIGIGAIVGAVCIALFYVICFAGALAAGFSSAYYY